MSFHVLSGTLFGIDGILVHVEVDLLRKLPSITIVGLPDSAVRESADRVRSAFQQSGFDLPRKRIVINLAPAALKKNGAAFDLPIAIGILSASGHIPQKDISNILFAGELSLSGALRPIKGALSLVLMAKKEGISRVVIPYKNAQEATLVPDIEIIAAKNLCEAVAACFNKSTPLQPQPHLHTPTVQPDMKEVKGQHRAKRALEIAAAGGHNLLMIGAPGCGKTMLALRLPSILPIPSFKEALEITQIYSAAGLQDQPYLQTIRPFRAPHHSISCSGMLGNAQLQPGEASLAHHGVLFLDELPEFRRDVLEALRAPLEDRYIQLVRAQGRVLFPANISLVAAANPCPCGYFGHPHIPCRCTYAQRQRYLIKLSGPFFDRMDIQLWIDPLSGSELLKAPAGEDSKTLRQRVSRARTLQKKRYEGTSIVSNAQLQGDLLQKHTPTDADAQCLLEKALKKNTLSARGWAKVLKVSRTIADLESKPHIEEHHLLEALSYRLPMGGVA